MFGNPGPRWRGLLAVLLVCSAPPAISASSNKPDLGPNVSHIRPIHAGFGHSTPDQRHLHHPTTQRVWRRAKCPVVSARRIQGGYPVGFYTEVLGLGASPDAVRIVGNVHADASEPNNNATTTFWRAAEGFSISPAGGSMQWAVSQAAPFRRMHVRGDLVLHQHRGWASGGWMSDDLIDGQVDAGPQQQFISRNTEWGSWSGSNWNMVFLGVPHPPPGEWPIPPYTKIAETPIVREKPFLQTDRGRKLERLHSRTARRQRGNHLAWRHNAGAIDPHQPLSTSRSRQQTTPPPSTHTWPRERICSSRPEFTN